MYRIIINLDNCKMTKFGLGIMLKEYLEDDCAFEVKVIEVYDLKNLIINSDSVAP